MTELPHPRDIATIPELIKYVGAMLRLRGKEKDEQVASYIVGLETNERLDVWRVEEPDIEAILGDASDLEWSNGNPEELANMWKHIEFHLERLERRYLHEK